MKKMSLSILGNDSILFNLDELEEIGNGIGNQLIVFTSKIKKKNVLTIVRFK